MEINVVDFDNTIYDGDSSVDFYFFCLRRHPSILRYLPSQAAAAVKYFLGLGGKTALKQSVFSFLKGLEKTDQLVDAFWSVHYGKIKQWYMARDRAGDVIISASPQFLLEPACRKLGVRMLIASRVDPKTGLFDGENCYGPEKVRRLDRALGDPVIREFYSDSRSDQPLADLAGTSYYVRGNRLVPW